MSDLAGWDECYRIVRRGEKWWAEVVPPPPGALNESGLLAQVGPYDSAKEAIGGLLAWMAKASEIGDGLALVRRGDGTEGYVLISTLRPLEAQPPDDRQESTPASQARPSQAKNDDHPS